jgi:hypothetical protein
MANSKEYLLTFFLCAFAALREKKLPSSRKSGFGKPFFKHRLLFKVPS